MYTLRKIKTIALKELYTFFLSPLAYVVLTSFFILNGYVFFIILRMYGDTNAPSNPPLQVMFGDVFFWLLILIMVPVITMRSFAAERESGRIEVLLTSPLSALEIVAGKFAGAFLSYAAVWSFSLIYAIAVYWVGRPDIGPVISSYVGILLLGLCYISMGIFASAMARTQLVSAIVCFVLLMLFFSIGVVEAVVSTQWIRDFTAYLSVFHHFEDFTNGIIDTRHVLFYLTLTPVFLFLSVRAIGAKQ